MPTSYTQLYTDIQDWAWDDSTELSGQVPTIIQLGELRLRRDLPLIAYDVTTTGTFSGTGVSGATLSLPSLRVADRYFQVTVSGGTPTMLERRQLAYLLEYWPTVTTTGTPRYYGQQGSGSLRVAPTPASGTTWEWGMKSQLPPLSVTNSTNWLTSNAEDALLQACLVEAARYKQDSDMEKRFEGAYQIAKAGISTEALTALSDDYGGTVTPRARE